MGKINIVGCDQGVRIVSSKAFFDTDFGRWTWQQAYFNLLSYKNTFSDAVYSLDVLDGNSGVYVELILYSFDNSGFWTDLLTDLGYRNIQTELIQIAVASADNTSYDYIRFE